LAAKPSRLAANLGAVIGFDFFATEEHGKHGQRQRRRLTVKDSKVKAPE
jgi:hypothetical protein